MTAWDIALHSLGAKPHKEILQDGDLRSCRMCGAEFNGSAKKLYCSVKCQCTRAVERTRSYRAAKKLQGEPK